MSSDITKQFVLTFKTKFVLEYDSMMSTQFCPYYVRSQSVSTNLFLSHIGILLYHLQVITMHYSYYLSSKFDYDTINNYVSSVRLIVLIPSTYLILQNDCSGHKYIIMSFTAALQRKADSVYKCSGNCKQPFTAHYLFTIS